MKSLCRRYSSVPLLLFSLCVPGLAPAQPEIVDASTSSAVATGLNTTAASSSMLELLNRLDQLENEIRQLRGDSELMSHEAQGIKRRQRELYLDIDKRLRELELGAVHTKPVPVTPAPAVMVPTPTAQPPVVVSPPVRTAVTPSVPPSDEKTTYKSAFNLLKEGRYQQSINAFNNFLSIYPNSTYADNAQYWLGEANYVSRKYKNAIVEFDKVIANHPGSPKIADAMLKKGFTHYELGEWDAARRVLEEVTARYPDSTATRLAGTRLERMGKEGR